MRSVGQGWAARRRSGGRATAGGEPPRPPAAHPQPARSCRAGPCPRQTAQKPSRPSRSPPPTCAAARAGRTPADAEHTALDHQLRAMGQQLPPHSRVIRPNLVCVIGGCGCEARTQERHYNQQGCPHGRPPSLAPADRLCVSLGPQTVIGDDYRVAMINKSSRPGGRLESLPRWQRRVSWPVLRGWPAAVSVCWGGGFFSLHAHACSCATRNPIIPLHLCL